MKCTRCRKPHDGLTKTCEPCKAHNRVWNLKTKYGLSVEDYNRKLKDQLGFCANPGCKRLLVPGRQTAIDHCHLTGKIRGLLCIGCNVALGHMEEDKSRIRGLEVYINSWTPQ